jgi:hypothetical protein
MRRRWLSERVRTIDFCSSERACASQDASSLSSSSHGLAFRQREILSAAYERTRTLGMRRWRSPLLYLAKEQTSDSEVSSKALPRALSRRRFNRTSFLEYCWFREIQRIKRVGRDNKHDRFPVDAWEEFIIVLDTLKPKLARWFTA